LGYLRREKLGATRLTIDADPEAAPFYRSMAAYDVGPSAVWFGAGQDAAKISDEPLPAD